MLWYITWTFDEENLFKIIEFSNEKNPDVKYEIKRKYNIVENFELDTTGPPQTYYTRLNLNSIKNGTIYYCVMETTNPVDNKKKYSIVMTSTPSKLT